MCKIQECIEYTKVNGGVSIVFQKSNFKDNLSRLEANVLFWLETSIYSFHSTALAQLS